MKVSGSVGSPDYWRTHFVSCPIIHLDGIEVAYVCEADDVAGFVIIEEYDGDRPKIDWAAGRYARRRIDGVVEIVGIPA